jgi:hypothetical protein
VPSLAAGDFDFLNTKIEGYRAARLAWGTANAQPITISFWTRHHRPGTYTVSIRNAPTNNRAYVTSYTHNVADVAQYNVVTIPGDTTGTWFTDNRAFMELGFAMACGTNLAAPSANNWLAGSYVGAPGQINAIAATTDAFRITGLTVFPGNEAPSAARAPFIVRPYDQELSLCKRYLQIVLPEGAGIANGTTACGFSIRHSGMRAVPTATTTNVVTISDIAALNSTQSAVGVNISGNDAEGGWYYLLNFPSNLTLGKIYICLGGALSAGRVKLDARL